MYASHNLPRTEIIKAHRGHVMVSGAPGKGRTLPHSGQKFGSPLKQDISATEKE